MEWIIVLILVVIGFFLLIIEFLVLPGVNVAGIIGFACVCFGVYLGYKFFGRLVILFCWRQPWVGLL